MSKRALTTLSAVFLFWAMTPGPASAQEQTFHACYVPEVGAMYLIGLSGLPTECLSSEHVEISWTEGGAAVTDHGELTGLSDDDHPEYVREGESAGGDLAGTFPDPSVAALRGNALSSTAPSDGQVLIWNDGATTWEPQALPSGVTDHGNLSGLTDDDHAQYLLTDGVSEATEGFAVTGTSDTGVIPVEGAGTRMMWYPAKAAFRAGEVFGSAWDNANVGDWSVALGANTEASGNQSTAMGSHTTVSGDFSTAMGSSTIAGGSYSTAMGLSTTASGDGSTAMGSYTTASGFASTAMGNRASTNGHQGAFVYGDRSTTSDLQATGSNQFLIRAVGGVGIGTNNPTTQLEVRRSVSGVANSISNHVAFVNNTAGSGADVLALQLDRSTPTGGNNYITFFAAGSDIGAIEGNGSGGIRLKSGSGDFAEMLPRRVETEQIEAGEVVGVRGGEVTRETAGADRVMVVTDRALVVGNDPGADARADYEKVAFLGQVPVKVRGPVSEGDLLVASGHGDGTARAVSAERWDPRADGPVVGRAWESASGEDVREVTAAVGLDSGAEVLGRRLQAQAETIEELRSENVEQGDAIEAQQERIKRLEALVEQVIDSEGPEVVHR